jgi:fucose permease
MIGPVSRPWARIAVTVTFFVNGLLFASWTAHIPHVKSHLGLSDATLGLALLGAPVGSVLAMVAATRLLPRLGSRRVVQLSLVGYCAAGPFLGLAGTPFALFATLLVWGAFQGTLDVSMNTQAITVENQQPHHIMSGLHGFWSIGSFAGAATGAACVAAGIALSPQLIGLAIPALVVAAVLSPRLLSDPPPELVRPEAQRVRKVNATVLLLSGVAMAAMLCEGAAADWSAVYLHDSVHTTASVAGVGFAAFSVAMVSIRLLGRRLFGRFSASRLISTLAAVATVGFAAGLLIGRPIPVLIGFGCLGLGLASVIPTVFGAAGRVPGLSSGVGVAVVSAFGWIGFVCGPPLIGQLAELTSLGTALGVVPVLTALVSIVALRSSAFRSNQRAAA